MSFCSVLGAGVALGSKIPVRIVHSLAPVLGRRKAYILIVVIMLYLYNNGCMNAMFGKGEGGPTLLFGGFHRGERGGSPRQGI